MRPVIAAATVALVVSTCMVAAVAGVDQMRDAPATHAIRARVTAGATGILSTQGTLGTPGTPSTHDAGAEAPALRGHGHQDTSGTPGTLRTSSTLGTLGTLSTLSTSSTLSTLSTLGTLRTLRTSSTLSTQVSGYICPMHPDVIEAAPGKCPRCSMDLVPGNPLGTADYHLSVETTPGVVEAGRATTFRFLVRDPVTREPVRNFAVVHDKPYHLFVLSRDTSVFMHEHPSPDDEGAFSLTVTLPRPGHYVFISDFFPIGGSGQVLTTPIVTAGFDGDVTAAIPTLTPDDSWSREAGGVRVDLRMPQSALVASEDIDLPFHFSTAGTGEPVTDLERYLGAFAHALIVNEDLTGYIHAHPEETLEGTEITSGGGPEVVFHTLFPKGGRYKAWIQFQREGQLSTVPFTFKVLRPGELITGAGQP